ncbi:methyltransferase domain-containing protein, partial [candidate division KSB1 bacterium]|nr:methyltransferase domain-containing protein [candidate division KSB1 bacterium]NIT71278.1 methyltransferase domain-containing protein [candidate division KSB1 bacterium]NIU93249.1 methyltransferase domain-containing protein [candidate division KSB1 bacterium]NIW69378.1 methyltransferase domain-containing protein [candidate division KSB1 bacterium]NIX70958.1 methyltransferase domain-containing protein [candidate division KSB1 bacterium]
LDMGGGGGRNAIFLAQHGFDVTAVDISETGLEQVRTDAHKEGVEVATQQQKLEDF